MALAKWSDDGTKLLTFFIELNGLALHGDVNLGDMLARLLLLNNFLDLGQRMLLLVNPHVESTEVKDPANSLVLFGDDEGSSCPFGGANWTKDANGDEVVQFFLEGCQVSSRQAMRLGMKRDCIWLEGQVELFVGVDSELATEC